MRIHIFLESSQLDERRDYYKRNHFKESTLYTGSAFDSFLHSSILIPRYYAFQMQTPNYIIPNTSYVDPSIACPKNYADNRSENAFLYSLYYHNRERIHHQVNFTKQSNHHSTFATNLLKLTSESTEKDTIIPDVRNTEFRRRAFEMLTNSSNTKDSKAIIKPLSHQIVPEYENFTNVRSHLNRKSSPSIEESTSPSPREDHPSIQLPAYLRTRLSDDRLCSKSKNCRRSRTVFTEMQVGVILSLFSTYTI